MTSNPLVSQGFQVQERSSTETEESTCHNFLTNAHILTRPSTIPVSLIQRDILTFNRDAEHRSTLNIPVTMRLFGSIDRTILCAALRDVANRHEILRTTFPENTGSPRQEICGANLVPGLEVKQVDEQTVGQAFTAAIKQVFDLSCDAPFRAHLFSFNPGIHILLLVVHRIAFDGWSMDPLIRDLFAFYAARIGGRQPELPQIPLQYADYALRLEQTLEDSANRKSMMAGERKFRIENCNRVAKPTVMPKAAMESEGSGGRGIRSLRINPGLHDKLRAIAKQEGISISTVLQTGFAVLLTRLGTANEAVLGILTSGRNQVPKFMIGPFEKILPLRISTQGNPTFRQALKRTTQAYQTACEHQVLPFRSIINGVDVNCDAISQALFSVKSIGIEKIDCSGLKVLINPPAPTVAYGFELIFDLYERCALDGKPQGIEGSVVFNRNILDPGLVLDIFNQMMVLLKRAVLNPDASIENLLLEQSRMPRELNAIELGSLADIPRTIPRASAAAVHSGEPNSIPLSSGSRDPSVLYEAAEWQQRYVPFQDALQCRLGGIWEEVLDVSRIGIRDRFVDLGGDEEKGRRIIQRINKTFRKKLPISLIRGGTTVESLADSIFRELQFEPVAEVQARSPDSNSPLFFVHGDVSGGGLYTIELSQGLGAHRPFFSFAPHGLDGQAIPGSIEKMAEANLEILRCMQPSGSFYLGGFCNGALVAYEMATMLEREGKRIPALLLIELPPLDFSEDRKHRLTPNSQPAARPGSQAHKIWVLSEIFRVSGDYQPKRYSGKVVVIQSEESFIGKSLIFSTWKRIAEDLEFHLTPGDHISCIGKHVSDLAAIVKKAID